MASTVLDATSTLPILPFLPDWSRHDEPDDDTGTDDTDGGDDTGGDDAGDEPAAKPAPKPAAKKTAAKPAVDDGEAVLGDAGKRVLAEARAARKAANTEAMQAKAELEAAQKKIQEYEDAQRNELEKAQAAAERALARERAANLRAVASDIRSYAITGNALDPSDVVDALSRDAEKFVTDSGVDSEAIEAAVEALLEKKKHWRKPAVDPAAVADGEGKSPKKRATPAPAPDPAQGSKGGSNTNNWDDPATFAAEARRLGLPAYR